MADCGVDTARVVAARRALTDLTEKIEREHLPIVRRALGMPAATFSHSPGLREEYYVEVTVRPPPPHPMPAHPTRPSSALHATHG